MREGWTYKKLGEVTTKIVDGSHNPPKGIDYSEYPMLSSKNIFFDNFNYDSPRYLSQKEFDLENKRTDISDGDVLLTIVGTVGRTCCVKYPFVPFTLQRSVAVLKPKKNLLTSRFFMFALHSLSDLWNNEAKGVAQKGIYLKQLATIPIPVPPLSEQERIVSELDLLSSIIEKKKEQLKEFDQLAQSIFYDMFGDPIENPKGWEIKEMGLIGECVSGGTPSRNNSKYFSGDINWFSAGELNNMFLYDSVEKITKEALESSSAKLCKPMSLFIGMYDTAAFKLGIPKKESASNQACANVCLYHDNVVWLYFTLFLMREEALKHRHGARQKNLNLGYIKKFKLPIPPLSFQQSFAEKIEAIERQKELIKQSIAETETLFNSRMDYYFN